MVINTTGSRAGLYSRVNAAQEHRFQERDEWTDIQFSHNGIPEDDYKLSLSLCVADFSTATFPITADSLTPRKEPVLAWDVSHTTFNTVAIQHQMVKNATSTPDDRGLLTLDATSKASWKELATTDLGRLTEETYGAGWEWAATSNTTAIMCTHCYDSPATHQTSSTKWVNPAHVGLFQDIIKTTGHQALETQAHFTTMVQMVYYDNLPTNRGITEVKLAEFVQVTLPKRFWGFTATFSLVAMHLILIGVVARNFLGNVKFSVSAWLSLNRI